MGGSGIAAPGRPPGAANGKNTRGFTHRGGSVMVGVFGFVGVSELIPLLVFAGFVAGLWGVLSLISNRNSRAQERLDRISRPASLADLEDPRTRNRQRFAGMVETAKALSGPLMPKTEGEQSELRNRLANAGF